MANPVRVVQVADTPLHGIVRSLFTPAPAEGLLKPEVVPKKSPTRPELGFLSASPAETGSAVWALSLAGTLER